MRPPPLGNMGSTPVGAWFKVQFRLWKTCIELNPSMLNAPVRPRELGRPLVFGTSLALCTSWPLSCWVPRPLCKGAHTHCSVQGSHT